MPRILKLLAALLASVLIPVSARAQQQNFPGAPAGTGSGSFTTVALSAPYTLVLADFTTPKEFLVTAASPITITLPSTMPPINSPSPRIRNVLASASTVTVSRNGHTVNQSAADQILQPGQYTQVTSDGVNDYTLDGPTFALGQNGNSLALGASGQASTSILRVFGGPSGAPPYIDFKSGTGADLAKLFPCSGSNAIGIQMTGPSGDCLATSPTLGDVFIKSPVYQTNTNCGVSSVSPAACGSAAAGSVAVPTGATTYTVNTSAVTANSQVIIQQDTSTTLGTRLAVTCNTTANVPLLTAKVAGVSFTFSLAAPVTNPACYSYSVVN